MFTGPFAGPADTRSSRRGAMLAAFALQFVVLTSLVVTQLLDIQPLPRLVVISPVVSLKAPDHLVSLEVARPETPAHKHNIVSSDRLALSSVFGLRERAEDDVTPPEIADYGPLDGAESHLVYAAVLGNLDSLAPPSLFPPPEGRPLLISQLTPGDLIDLVKPVYPRAAVRARIQGQVQLRARIGREGTVEALQLIAGHPLLAPAAIAAVRQWRYRPYYLDGTPVEVETQVTVVFVLSRA